MVVSAGLGAPLALLTCVGIPLLPCLLLLLHQRGHLDSPDVKRRLAFLYCSCMSQYAQQGVRLLCILYIILCSYLPGNVCQDSCWKCAQCGQLCECETEAWLH